MSSNEHHCPNLPLPLPRLQNSISCSDFNRFEQPWVSNPKAVHALLKTVTKMKIRPKAFVLLLIKHRKVVAFPVALYHFEKSTKSLAAIMTLRPKWVFEILLYVASCNEGLSTSKLSNLASLYFKWNCCISYFREMSFFYQEGGLLKIGGIRYFFLDQEEGSKEFFKLKRGII